MKSPLKDFKQIEPFSDFSSNAFTPNTLNKFNFQKLILNFSFKKMKEFLKIFNLKNYNLKKTIRFNAEKIELKINFRNLNSSKKGNVKRLIRGH